MEQNLSWLAVPDLPLRLGVLIFYMVLFWNLSEVVAILDFLLPNKKIV
jgi:hypothetical protein